MLSIGKSGFRFSNPDFGFPKKTQNPTVDVDEPKSFSRWISIEKSFVEICFWIWRFIGKSENPDLEIQIQISQSKAPSAFLSRQLKTSAFELLYGGEFTLLTQLIKPNFHVSLSTHRHSTIVSLITNRFIH